MGRFPGELGTRSWGAWDGTRAGQSNRPINQGHNLEAEESISITRDTALGKLRHCPAGLGPPPRQRGAPPSVFGGTIQNSWGHRLGNGGAASGSWGHGLRELGTPSWGAGGTVVGPWGECGQRPLTWGHRPWETGTPPYGAADINAGSWGQRPAIWARRLGVCALPLWNWEHRTDSWGHHRGTPMGNCTHRSVGTVLRHWLGDRPPADTGGACHGGTARGEIT
ncbi:hypothetical protein N9L68_00360 [bacterium]|nr:hypothetical protein [bacterium]